MTLLGVLTTVMGPAVGLLGPTLGFGAKSVATDAISAGVKGGVGKAFQERHRTARREMRNETRIAPLETKIVLLACLAPPDCLRL